MKIFLNLKLMNRQLIRCLQHCLAGFHGEIVTYLGASQGGWERQGDFLLTSKVLPKLRGGEDKLGSVLPPLLVYAITNAHDIQRLHSQAAEVIVQVADGVGLDAVIKRLGVDAARYPITADKVYRLTRQLLETGLASYF